ncbi:MarR family EPS-associated transcriptional regulator [Methylotetracoccus oryzae]|uniref:MarR family EPS-associated transcriptional regulator n=1 Tax=Methylotetracoccus oryzae TaxID=1919059 RepID=UPI00111ABDEE|nr:MarR family EPS-associated transcriptional regulator [Methylotetracoccus oryzae]
MTPREQAHLQVLKILAERPEISQRELAEALLVSLGKTNYLIKALVEKGLIKAENFRRSDKKLGYLYVLTPSGIDMRLRLMRTYLARKEAEYEALREEVEKLRNELGLNDPMPPSQ